MSQRINEAKDARVNIRINSHRARAKVKSVVGDRLQQHSDATKPGVGYLSVLSWHSVSAEDFDRIKHIKGVTRMRDQALREPGVREILAMSEAWLEEDFAASDADKAITYYHGTTTFSAAEKAFSEGIKSRELMNLPKSKKRMAPVHDRVYMTRSLETAVVYAIGGVMMGHEPPPHWGKESKYGGLLVIPGSELQDVEPDEDQVGEYASKTLPGSGRGGIEDYRVSSAAERHLSPTQLRKLKAGEYAVWAQAGKKLLKVLSDQDKRRILAHFDKDSNIAAKGMVRATQLWRIDRMRCKEIKPDASNFFDIAERVA